MTVYISVWSMKGQTRKAVTSARDHTHAYRDDHPQRQRHSSEWRWDLVTLKTRGLPCTTTTDALTALQSLHLASTTALNAVPFMA